MAEHQHPFVSCWARGGTNRLHLKTGEWRYARPAINYAKCRQCGWCSILCPVGCMKVTTSGYFVPDLDFCKGCAICARECPAQAISMLREEVG